MIVVAILLGIISWTFFEYLIHRFLGHKKRANNPITKEHHRHHAEGGYFAPVWGKLLLAVMVLMVLTTIIGLPFGWNYGFAYSLGLTAMYLLYEVLHKRAHTHAPLLPYGKHIRLHHFHHHFRNPKVNHGVTTRFWDLMFNTLEIPEQVKVPRKMALSWLVDGSGRVLPPYESDYVLVGQI